ncbi:MAG: hypothetical protein AAFY76_01060 [Cyanobacteria bacterium J06649_11]
MPDDDDRMDFILSDTISYTGFVKYDTNSEITHVFTTANKEGMFGDTIVFSSMLLVDQIKKQKPFYNTMQMNKSSLYYYDNLFSRNISLFQDQYFEHAQYLLDYRSSDKSHTTILKLDESPLTEWIDKEVSRSCYLSHTMIDHDDYYYNLWITIREKNMNIHHLITLTDELLSVIDT